MLAFVPAIALSAFWIAGEHALVMVALGLPILYLLTGTLNEAHAAKTREVDATTGLPMIDQLENDAEEMIISCSEAGRKSALFLFNLKSLKRLFNAMVKRPQVHCWRGWGKGSALCFGNMTPFIGLVWRALPS